MLVSNIFWELQIFNLSLTSRQNLAAVNIVADLSVVTFYCTHDIRSKRILKLEIKKNKFFISQLHR